MLFDREHLGIGGGKRGARLGGPVA